MTEKIERLPNRQEDMLVALAAHELEAVEGGLDRDHCGTCSNPLHPSLPPSSLPPSWDLFAKRTLLG